MTQESHNQPAFSRERSLLIIKRARDIYGASLSDLKRIISMSRTLDAFRIRIQGAWMYCDFRGVK